MTDKPYSYCGVHGEPIKGNDCWNCCDVLEFRAKSQERERIIKIIEDNEERLLSNQAREYLIDKIKSEYKLGE